MLRKFTIALMICVFLISASAPCSQAKQKKKWVKSPDGVKTLMELSKDMGAMKKEVKHDTRNYDKVKRDVENGKLEVGQTADNILKKYGTPVYTLSDPGQGKETWVYKVGTEPVKTKNKVYLVFSLDSTLISWNMP